MSSTSQVYSSLAGLNGWKFHVKHLKLGNAQQVMQHSVGTRSSPRKGRGMDFSETRPYQIGDEVRHIDWRVTARTQKAHTKLFMEEEERKVFFIVEQSSRLFLASIYKLKIALALDILALLAFAAENQGDKVSCKLLEGHDFSGHQVSNINQFFELALAKQQSTTPTQTSPSWKIELQKVSRLIQPNTKVVLIGDMFSLNNAQEELQNLRKHNDILAIHLTDYLETNLPPNRILKISDGFQEIQLNATKEMQQTYKNQYLTRYQSLESSMTNIGVSLVNVNTQDDLLAKLLSSKVLVK